MADNHTTSRCIYCNKTFAHKRSLDDHVIKVHPEFIASVSSKIHKCTHCTFKTTIATCMREHLVIADNSTTKRCIHCNRTFASKQTLDDHIVKRHPDFITSVSGKVHECTKCTYKTANTTHLKEHILDGNRVTSTCIYCNKTFVRKATLDNHIVKTHPDFIASVSRKVHECTKCTYKTVRTSHLKQHIKASHRVTSTCIYCNKTFVRKETLDDHIVRTHPDFIASVSRKVHECTRCTYKTVRTSNLKEHIMANNRITKTCIYCNKTFVREQTLDDHILKTHPDFITSVSRTVHECTKCTYKTVRASYLKEHILDIAGNRLTNRCIYCNKIFVRKRTLDDHIVKRHPDFITSVSRKVHECTKCTYRTVSINHLKEHITVNHPDIVRHCIYCNKTFAGKRSFDAHVIKIHPDLIASVSSKIHECAHCSYKTVMANVLKEHILDCKASFTRQEFLNEHILQIHPQFTASIARKVLSCPK
nr:unnamed protein product [Callosobruchus analis]